MLEILKDREEILKNRKDNINREVQKYERIMNTNPDQKEEAENKVRQLEAEMFDTVPRLALYSEQWLAKADTKEEVFKRLKTSSTLNVSKRLKKAVGIVVNREFVGADRYCDTFFKVVNDECLFITRLLDLQGEGDVIYQELQTFGSKDILNEIAETLEINPVRKSKFEVTKFRLFVVGSIAAIGTILYHYFFK